jgi:hypothetical protein
LGATNSPISPPISPAEGAGFEQHVLVEDSPPCAGDGHGEDRPGHHEGHRDGHAEDQPRAVGEDVPAPGERKGMPCGPHVAHQPERGGGEKEPDLEAVPLGVQLGLLLLEQPELSRVAHRVADGPKGVDDGLRSDAVGVVGDQPLLVGERHRHGVDALQTPDGLLDRGHAEAAVQVAELDLQPGRAVLAGPHPVGEPTLLGAGRLTGAPRGSAVLLELGCHGGSPPGVTIRLPLRWNVKGKFRAGVPGRGGKSDTRESTRCGSLRWFWQLFTGDHW